VNYANEPSQAELEQSSQDTYDVIRLTRSKAAVWTINDVARSIEIKKKILFTYLFLPSECLKLDRLQNSSKLYSMYLFIIFYSKRFV